MPPRAIVLYEDQRGPVDRFGLHELVVACVADTLGFRPDLDGRPLKGNGNVRRSCRHLRRIASRGEHVVAIFDGDKAYRSVDLDKSASEAAIAAKVAEDCDAPELLHVKLLDDNQETVIDALAHCDPSASQEMVKRALRKDPNARDVLLGRVARDGAVAIRRCMVDRVPSLRAIVDLLVRLLAGP